MKGVGIPEFEFVDPTSAPEFIFLLFPLSQSVAILGPFLQSKGWFASYDITEGIG